ncbi:Sugar kinase of the NBD/HSP70 family, may contain an N-terminal HTH domain [Nakamurella panacisegetis]|uniref:Sugar kinase of the NBD/HSP70 family, may contain an N-terminal HTH domain n=1 Tax=Nakamurella panacisegetis TaxID=1090615 RepID=A0A1H0KDG6_9ACTN|nr:ROK family protein [Nakamurella panacisegetis]SDO54008.1 Sugar kinase of the NBD/HSP70 family, may contain an N-terminal HTH domain [Nakamurella panacisegetis]
MTEFGVMTSGRTPLTPARQASLREHNLGMVLDQIVNAATPPSRADIAGATGLTRATVSALADHLLAGRLIAELAPVSSQRAGRPAVPLVPAARTLVAVGLEVNVDYLGVRAIDLTGAVLAESVEPGDFRNTRPEPVLAALAALFAGVVTPLEAEGIPMAGCYVALPGLVDRNTGPLRLAPNLGWESVDVVGLLTRNLQMNGTPVALANEAKLAARAEAEARRPDDVHSFFYVSGEIGIGGAIVTDGAVVPGRHGWSGEIGHTLIDPNGPLCGCGSHGCLEQYAGKDALMRAARLPQSAPVRALLDSVGSPSTDTALAEGGRALGIALSNTANLIDVDTLVLGGVYTSLAPYLIPPIQRELAARVLSHRWSPVTVQAARSVDYAALTGGAKTVLGDIVMDPNSWTRRVLAEPTPIT